ncbi:hypothetical protein [Saccharopolyspora pogona]|uniref:hypothetical protein n=1 Tax=Saccharopolyspora pogona TaxID=333966 RepID=UPI001683BA39|nr:hypothetical protein [Saccharopolyspora pogona]
MHACRVAVGLFFPVLVLLMSGRPDLIIYAVFGSFTGMYGRAESHLSASNTRRTRALCCSPAWAWAFSSPAATPARGCWW